jgi:gas vesicle protein
VKINSQESIKCKIKMENSNKTMSQAGGFIVGAVVGAILGVLFAPNKGSETRRHIANTRDNLTNSIKDQYGNLIDIVNDEIAEVKTKATEALEYGVGKVEKAKSNLAHNNQ